MNSKLSFLPLLRSGIAASALLLACALPATAQTYFRVNSDGANTSGPILTIDHPSLNGKPKVKPLIMGTFPLARYEDALRVVQERKVLGKVVILMDDA